jgi:uncharacterized membrane protein YfcA
MSEIFALLPLIFGLMAAGVLAGLVAGMLGAGGGVVTVPAMAMVFHFLGFSPEIYHHVAVGTSLAIIIAIGTTSSLAHHKRGAVMLDIIKLWAPFIIIAALAGGLMARFYSGDMLRIIFGIVALFVAINILLPIQQRLMGQLSGSKITHRIVAIIVGYVSALMGIGGGSLSVPSLVAFGHKMHKSVGTGAALGVLIAVPATIGFIISGWGVAGRPPLSIGYINLPALVLIGVVASVVAPFGVILAHKLNQRHLKLGFAIFLFMVGARMIIQAFFG